MATEQRLIDANALLERMNVVTADDTCPLHIAAEIDQEIALSPTVDAVEVVHGRWVWWAEERSYFTSYDEDYGYVCSECGTKAEEWGVDGDIPEEPPTRLHYCPNCGAKMDGERRADNG